MLTIENSTHNVIIGNFNIQLFQDNKNYEKKRYGV